jgi:hypothetical protein
MARNHDRLQFIVLLVSSVSLLSVSLSSTSSAADQDEPTWTIMVYMAADAEPVLPWEEDMNEMEAANLMDWMDVVVLIDPLGFGDSVLLEVERDTGPDIVSKEIDDAGEVIPMTGEADMASPDTLRDFVTFTARNYPADRFALVLWGHSGGWYGLCQDGSVALQLPDLAYALGTATEEMGRKLDIVIADSCAEGVLETMYELREAADWYVGSEMTVPAQGLRYDLVLDSLSRNRNVTPEDWGAHICEIHRVTLYFESWSATMATFDLGALDGFARSLEALSSSMEGYAGIYRGVLMGALLQTAASDLVEWYLDMGDALKKLASSSLPLEIRYMAFETLQAYDALVYDFELYASPFEDDFDAVSNYTGAAIYAPGDEPMDELYGSLSFSAVGWGDSTSLIRSDEPTTVNQLGPEVTYNDSDGDGELDEAVLHWDLDCDKYAAWVFSQTDEGVRFVGSFESDVPSLAVGGVAGDLTVSASAWTQGSAVSHHGLNIHLTRTVDVCVRVMSGGGPVSDGLNVRIWTAHGPVGLSHTGDMFCGWILVPDEAAFGDLLTVEVIGTDGEVLAWNRSYVQGTEVVLEIRLVKDIDDPVGTQFLIPAAILGVCAIVAALYVSDRMRRRGDTF